MTTKIDPNAEMSVQEQMQLASDASFEQMIQREKLVGGLTNWRKVSQRQKSKVLDGYGKILSLIYR